ncbi:20112_t:CDS:1 [Gigaspora margarita]|uniref:20112_t:CDS:1 n=1 Tax=Gigaspora margarita TaxID=4874 RepID=A0ABN7VRN3_GIGMA|nr:20112_t:CDS:1 [Gigaspora margarita]
MSTSINNNFQENLDKIPSLNLEIVELKSNILELFNLIELLQNSTNNNKQLEDLYNLIQWKQIILDNTIAELTDFINIDPIEEDKYIKETYDLTAQLTKYILEQ